METKQKKNKIKTWRSVSEAIHLGDVFKMETYIKDVTVPLSIDCAQRYTPQIRAELSQLRNVISYLHDDVKHM